LFRANLQSKRLFVPELGKYIRVTVSTRMLRTIDKIGLSAALKKNNLSYKDLTSGPKQSKTAAA
jgi:large subunit ribosomal protein L28